MWRVGLFAALLTAVVPVAHASDVNWSSAVGSFQDGGIPLSDRVVDLEYHNDKLFAGGWFLSAVGSGNARHLARLVDGEWRAVNAGSPNDDVTTLYSAGPGELYVGGVFTQVGTVPAERIAKLDSGTWVPLGAGFDDAVLCLTEYAGELIAAGYFQNSGTTSVQSIARWDGASWQSLGQGLDYTGGSIPEAVVVTAAEWNGELWVGGWIDDASGVPVTGLAVWDGAAWRSGGDLVRSFGCTKDVDTLLPWPGVGLVVGGSFESIDGVYCNGLAIWDGANWTGIGGQFGSDAGVEAVALLEGDLVAMGSFGGANGIRTIARWDGSNWSPLGSGLYSAWLGCQYHALEAVGSQLYCGGYFYQAGDKDSYNIALWDEALSVDVPVLVPTSRSTLRAHPNPSFGTVEFVEMADGAPLRVAIFDVSGRRVRSLEGAGGSVVWDGALRNGEPAPAGVYFARPESNPGGVARFVLRR